jgi:hypothetical protein
MSITRDEVIALVGLLLLAVLAALIVIRTIRRREAEARLIVVADFVEVSEASAIGGISVVLLVVWNAGVFALFLGGTLKTSIHEIATLLAWLGGNQLWIAGMTLGRKRRFIMRQQPKPPLADDRREPAP